MGNNTQITGKSTIYFYSVCLLTKLLEYDIMENRRPHDCGRRAEISNYQKFLMVELAYYGLIK